jgi:UDP-N-acetylmuramyl pentapeptide phosphotransferase/UDP-N-acetylglucosamine-1-phosphate transferase
MAPRGAAAVTDQLLIAALVAGVGATIVTRVVERLARQRSLLDIPNDRSSHDVPTPRIGGLGIVVGTVIGWLVAAGWTDGEATVIVLAALGLGAVGLLDDVRHTSVLGKYLAQLAAAAVVAGVLQPTLSIGIGDGTWSLGGIPAFVVTTIGLTALVNAVNFMDGIDGLIGSVALVAAIVAVGLVAPGAWSILLPFAAACAGFLVWNQAPASIFMGDGGSQFVGLILGAALLRQEGGIVDVVPVLLLISPLLFDTGFTLIRRARAGRDLFAGHREHLYQRVVVAGRSHREVAAGYAAATAVTGILALWWPAAPTVAQIAMLGGVALVAGLYAVWVARSEAHSVETGAPSG